MPWFRNVSIGWDNTPRYPGEKKESVVHYHNTPESFGAYLLRAVDDATRHPGRQKLIVINAWNEWIEGSYLLPDMRWGFGYLEAVEKVMERRRQITQNSKILLP